VIGKAKPILPQMNAGRVEAQTQHAEKMAPGKQRSGASFSVGLSRGDERPEHRDETPLMESRYFRRLHG